ncbi:sel1 repeat family protein [bacterium]|nr:sel1 repeat family protein [bacterium]
MIFEFLKQERRRAALYGLAAAGILLIAGVGCLGAGSGDNAAQKDAGGQIPAIAAVLPPQKENELKQAAESGDAKAQFQLGNYYHNLFYSTPYENKDKKGLYKTEALKWLKKSADSGCAEAQTELSGAYYTMTSDICTLNYIDSALWLIKAAEQNYPKALYKLGWRYNSAGGSMVSSHDIVLCHDKLKAYEWWRRAAERGDAEAQYEMGRFYDVLFYSEHIYGYPIGLLLENRLLNWDERSAQAEKWYKLSASHGNENAKDALEGLSKSKKIYDKIKNDPEIINKLKSKSGGDNGESLDSEISEFDIGDFDPKYKQKCCYFYDFNDIFAVDRTKLIKRLLKDAEKGYINAQLMLAEIYEGACSADKSIESLSAEERLSEAEKWYTAAAESGDGYAEKRLGNFQKKKLLREKAITNALSAEEKYELSNFYEKPGDLLFAFDPEKSLEWLKKSAEDGFAEAQYKLAGFYTSRINIENALKTDALPEAEKWYKAAAAQNYPDADAHLNSLNIFRGLAAKIAEHRLSAAEEYQLSEIYETFPQLINRHEAEEYLFKAARHGNTKARQRLMKEADGLIDPHNFSCHITYDEIASRRELATDYYRTASEYDSKARKKLEDMNRQSEEKERKINALSKQLAGGKADEAVKRELVALYDSDSCAPRNPEKAAELLCELGKNGNTGDLQSLCWKGEAYYHDQSEPYSVFDYRYTDPFNDNFDIKSYRQRELQLKKDAESGGSDALYKLGLLYYSEKNNRFLNYETLVSAALNCWKKAALQGHAGAQYCLGKHYSDHCFSHAEAVKWLLMAADQGDIHAMYELSFIMYNYICKYNIGIINVDPDKAFELCSKAAEQGYPKAQLLLGKMYAKGIGTEADAAQAEKWYEKAMQNGNYIAAFHSYLTKNGLINYL